MLVALPIAWPLNALVGVVVALIVLRRLVVSRLVVDVVIVVEIVVVVDLVRVVDLVMRMDIVPVAGVVDLVSTCDLGLVLSTGTLGRRRSRANNSTLRLSHSTCVLGSLGWQVSLEDICLGCI